MSISDKIVVMKEGLLHQQGAPQQVYDDPADLFVAKFLGTPPINVFSGRVAEGMLFIGEEAVLPFQIADGPVTVGIRPEGFVPQEDGPMTCELRALEILGRDASILCDHPAFTGESFRAIVDAGESVSGGKVRFRLKANKVFLFDPETGRRLREA